MKPNQRSAEDAGFALLVPAFGLMAYFFLRESPDEHPYDTDTMRGAAESYEEYGGDHH